MGTLSTLSSEFDGYLDWERMLKCLATTYSIDKTYYYFLFVVWSFSPITRPAHLVVVCVWYWNASFLSREFLWRALLNR